MPPVPVVGHFRRAVVIEVLRVLHPQRLIDAAYRSGEIEQKSLSRRLVVRGETGHCGAGDSLNRVIAGAQYDSGREVGVVESIRFAVAILESALEGVLASRPAEVVSEDATRIQSFPPSPETTF